MGVLVPNPDLTCISLIYSFSAVEYLMNTFNFLFHVSMALPKCQLVVTYPMLLLYFYNSEKTLWNNVLKSQNNNMSSLTAATVKAQAGARSIDFAVVHSRKISEGDKTELESGMNQQNSV